MITPLFIGTLGLPELLVIGLILTILFGSKKVPTLLKGLGQGLFQFKKAVVGEGDYDDGGTDREQTNATVSVPQKGLGAENQEH